MNQKNLGYYPGIYPEGLSTQKKGGGVVGIPSDSNQAPFKHRVLQKKLYNFERVYKFIQRTCTVF
jgi:hypothetical protein